MKKHYLLIGTTLLVLLLAACSPQNKYIEETSNTESGHQAVLKFTDSDFETEVLNSDQVVLVDFWATWCGPCKAMGPTIAKIAEKYEGKAKIGKVDVDDNPKTAKAYSVSSIPYFAIFKGGEKVESVVGMTSESNLSELIEKHMN
ncbi:MAG TPA: thioredoxin [Verrucomicrobiales bacterium]|jgi:thioredoxin 1|nr:thioredoxin [Verrucomicrobiales bacterium]HIL69450.1 thioredoxin [Verrucomicrobiota bacterium]